MLKKIKDSQTLHNTFKTKPLALAYKFINFRMGAFSGLVTGSLVGLINYSHGFLPALFSFFKQFVFNLFMAGLNIKTCERLARKFSNQAISLVSATLFPSAIAFVVLFATHYFGKTPNIWGTTVWQGIANLFIFSFMALTYRGIIELDNTYAYKFVMIFKLPVVFIKRRAKGIFNGKKQAV